MYRFSWYRNWAKGTDLLIKEVTESKDVCARVTSLVINICSSLMLHHLHPFSFSYSILLSRQLCVHSWMSCLKYCVLVLSVLSHPRSMQAQRYVTTNQISYSIAFLHATPSCFDPFIWCLLTIAVSVVQFQSVIATVKKDHVLLLFPGSGLITLSACPYMFGPWH